MQIYILSNINQRNFKKNISYILLLFMDINSELISVKSY